MASVKDHLRRKLIYNQLLKTVQPYLRPVERKQLDSMVAQEFIAAKLDEATDEYMFQGQQTPIPSVVLEMLYELMGRHQNIESIQVNMKSGQCMKLTLD